MTSFPIPQTEYTRRLKTLIRLALEEDLGSGDRTTVALGLGNALGQAELIARSAGVLAGADAFTATIRALDPRARLTWHVREGAAFRRNQKVAVIRARSSSLLSGERTALNFLSRLSGVATLTRTYARAIDGHATRLLDTRKTTPGWRLLEKRAAMLGGAVTHRVGLFDALMIKSNHVAAVGEFRETVRRALRGAGRRTLICEVRSMREVQIALADGVGWLLLDHFTPSRLRHAVKFIRAWDADRAVETRRKPTVIEVSGNVTLRTIGALARCGPDFISVGAITHSAPAADFSMRMIPN